MDIDGGFLKQHHAGVAATWRLADGFWVTISYLIARQMQPDATNTRDVVAMAMGVLAFYLVGESSGLYRTWRASPVVREIAPPRSAPTSDTW